jgi:glycosyltransferase involved in cell wall biosynthesis
VSIAIPCYNYGHYLPFALASALSQPDVDVVAIVVDDASTDGTQEIVRRLAESDERVHAILHSQNRGHVATINEALAHAHGEYVVLLSADDGLTPGALRRATALLDANPSVGLAYGFPLTFDDHPPPARERVRNWTVWPGREWLARCCRSGRNFIDNPEVVMRTSVQRRIGGYDIDLPHSGDLAMWLRAAAISDVGRVNGADQAYYRIHPDSMQRTTYSGHMADLEGRLAAFDRVLSGRDVWAGDATMFATARRALAFAALGYARAAYDNGLEEVEPVGDYLAFADRVWPAARTTRAWRVCERRRYATAGHGRGDRGALPRARRAINDITFRLRWRRWRWSGVW